jgi:acyl-homoserine lactone acylase PvdQ
VGGKPYAITLKRASHGRDVASSLGFMDLNDNAVRSARDFARVMNQVEFTFNWFYVDRRDIAYFSSGRLPIRAAGVNPSLPTLGTGQYEWRGFVPRSAHPQAIDPPSGMLLNWNNKPAPGWGASDENFNYGPVHRVQLFQGFKSRNQLQDVVSVMNRAATQDLPAVADWPIIRRVLNGGPAADQRSAQAASLVDAWVAKGAPRLDTTGTGKIDDPGAAIFDAAWPLIGKAVLTPVLGSLVDQLAKIAPVDAPASSNGSSYVAAFYGYVSKDLRSELGDAVKGPYSRRYCGNGDINACRASLWMAMQQAADSLAATQGPDPTAWRADANAERIVFKPGLLGPAATMRWTNRPTFQQVVQFAR